MAVKKQKFDIKKAQENAQKKKDRRNKIYAYILLAFFIFWTICSCLSIYNTITQHFSADNGRIVASADVVDENERYPSENLLSFSSFTYGGSNGLIYERNAQYGSVKFGSVDFGGNITESDKAVCISLFSNSVTANYYYGYQLKSSDLYLPVGTYTFSKNGTTVAGYKCGIVYGQLGQSGITGGTAVNQLNYDSYTFTLTQASYFAVVFEVNGNEYATAGQVYELFPMLNVGDTAYPFIPNLDMVYNAGYQQAENMSKYGFFVGGQVFIDGVYVVDIDLKNNGFRLDNIPASAYSGKNSFSVQIRFDLPVLLRSLPDLVVNADGLSNGAFNNAVVTFSNTVAQKTNNLIVLPSSIEVVRFSYSIGTGVGKYSFENVPSGIDVNSNYFVNAISTSVIYSSNAETTLPLTGLDIVDDAYQNGVVAGFNSGVQSSQGYQNGYNVGFADGEQAAVRPNYDKGYDAGYNVGFGAGEQAGLQAANDYSFFSFIAACIDAPIQAFMGLFNFEILGMNMSNFSLGLLTAAIIIIVLKFALGGI